MQNSLIKTLLVCILAVCPGFTTTLAAQQETAYWPGDTWEVSSPEAEGLDATAIGKLDAEIRAGKHGYIDSLLIARGGRIVFEASYEHDYSALNAGKKYPSPRPGIILMPMNTPGATTQDCITLGELLPHRKIDAPGMAGIRLENILTMTPGFDWNEDISYFDPANDASVVENLDDWGYGYQWWVFNHAGPDKPGMYGGWGWGGQFPLIVPDLGLIAVFTGWNIYEEEKHEYAFRLFYDRVVLSADR